MSREMRQRIGVALAGSALLLAAPTTGVAAPPNKPAPVVTVVAPTPAQGATLTTPVASIAFTWDLKPNQTRSVTCGLAGPTPSSAPCTTVAGPGKTSRASVSYTGLANGDYTFTATVVHNSGGSTTVTRSFAVLVPQTLFALRAEHWQNPSGRYLVIQGFTTKGGIAAGAYTGPTLTATWPDGTGTGSAPLTPFVDDGVYVRHRTRIRIGSGPGPMPSTVTISDGSGETDSVTVRPWTSTPATHVPGYRTQFFTHYMDAVEVRNDLDALAASHPELVSVVNLPEKSPGYQRKAQTIVGMSTAYDGSTTDIPVAEQDRAVVLTSKDWGQDGGNAVTVHLDVPQAPNAPLSVAVSGKDIAISLATSGAGALTSTAAQLVAAINASPPAGALVTASTYRGSPGADVAMAGPAARLSDFLLAPASVARGPFQQHLYRIGTHRDGSKVGVFLSCGESAREWVTPLVCLEAAHRFVENYATDPATTTLLDNLDIFVLPNVNPDGTNYSIYDSSGQAKTMQSYCPATGASDPAARRTWGVAIGHNFSVGSMFDGYSGASSACDDAQYAGPFEFSEPETRNVRWVGETFPNVMFAANVTTGGSITWAPSSYVAPGRVSLPVPAYFVQGYLRQTAQAIVSGVQTYRGTTIGADRVDAGIDVHGSQAGSYVDDVWYRKGVFAFDIGTGVPKQTSTTSGATVDTGVQPCFGALGTGGGQGHCDSSLLNEGRHEAMEFPEGLNSLLLAALAYSDDVTAPTVNATGPSSGTTSALVGFDTDDATEVFYTLDGSTPTLSSPTWAPAVPGDERAPLRITQTTTIKWFGMDVKGNQSAVQTRTVTIG